LSSPKEVTAVTPVAGVGISAIVPPRVMEYWAVILSELKINIKVKNSNILFMRLGVVFV
jgi:hypothetical protein